jgi:hypothetical protein
LPPHSGLERSDFVPWPGSTSGESNCLDGDKDAGDVCAEAHHRSRGSMLDLYRIQKMRALLIETIYLPDTADPDRLTELNDRLRKLERYERRANSKRNRALRGL